MTPTSIPAPPPLVSTQTASLDAIALFRRYGSRAAYLAAFGVVAPPFDLSRPAQDWFDTSVDTSEVDNQVLYDVVRQGKLHQMSMLARDAAQPNLPGDDVYPPYVVAPTAATRTGPGDLTPQPVNPDYLSTMDQALRIKDEVGGTAVFPEMPMGGGFGISYPPGEARSLWDVAFNGRNVNAGLLLKNKSVNGVGAPGRWDLSGEEPVWIPTTPRPFDASKPLVWREMPVRRLLPNEAIQSTLMGFQIVRTDMAAAAVTSAGGFGPNEQRMLSEMYGWFKRMGN